MARFLALGALALAPTAILAESKHLTTADFETTTTNGDFYMVKFYAPWCGHCKKLAPTWDALAEETLTTSAGKAVHFVSVDCTAKEGQSLCTDAGVKGYPTILTYGGADGPAGKYNGGREADALRAFATSQ